MLHDEITTFAANLQRIVNWDRCDILEKELNNVKQNVKVQSFETWQLALNDALHTALIKNRVEMVRLLLEAGADLQLYATTMNAVLKYDADRRFDADEDTQLKVAAATRWTDLLWCHKEDPLSSHVLAFLMPLKEGSKKESLQPFEYIMTNLLGDKPSQNRAMKRKYKLLRKESTIYWRRHQQRAPMFDGEEAMHWNHVHPNP